MDKEIEVKAALPRDGERSYIGLEVCRGPGVMRLILTRPYRAAGQAVDIPLKHVKSVARVAATPQGEPHRTTEPTAAVRPSAGQASTTT